MHHKSRQIFTEKRPSFSLLSDYRSSSRQILYKPNLFVLGLLPDFLLISTDQPPTSSRPAQMSALPISIGSRGLGLVESVSFSMGIVTARREQLFEFQSRLELGRRRGAERCLVWPIHSFSLPEVLVIVVRRITSPDAFIFKAVRLRALEDAPYAFGSTYAKESQFGDSEWLRRVGHMNGERGIGFLAFDDETACGIVGSFLDENDPAQAHVVSMWTAPNHRCQSVGRLLIKEVLAWAHGRNVHTIRLMVTSNNEPAIRFYERLGFTRTGRTEPYPNDPAVVEYEMSRAIP